MPAQLHIRVPLVGVGVCLCFILDPVMAGFEPFILCFLGNPRGDFCLTPRFLAEAKMPQRPTNQTFFDTTHFRIHYDTTDTAAVGMDYVRLIAGIAEYCWEIEVDSMGFDEPPPDDTAGGDSRYDIYIVPLWDGAAGYCASEGQGPDHEQEDYITYIALSYHLDTTNGQTEAVVAHEFMHACEMSYTALDGDWFMENCSQWATEMVYPDLNYYMLYFNMPATPFNRPNYEITHAPYSNPDYYEYAATTWPLFLMFWTADTGIIEACWDSMGRHWGNHTLEDIDGVLRRDYGDSLESAMADYALWRWFSGRMWDNWHWSEAALWPTVRVLRTHSSYPASGNEGIFPIYGPGGTDLIVFNSYGQAESLYIYFDGQDGYTWGASVIGYRSGPGVPSDIYRMDIDTNGYGAIAVPTLDYDSLVLVPYCLNWPFTTHPLSFIYSANTVSVEEGVLVESGVSGSLSRERFIFTLPRGGNVCISVYDVSGRLVFGREGLFEAGKNQLNMARPLKPGIYIWELDFEGMRVMKNSLVF